MRNAALFLCLYGREIRFARMGNPFHAARFCIFRLRIHILSLKMCISNLRICIFSLKMKFLPR